MGVLMESSQINIHSRAEQNLKPGALFAVDKCRDKTADATEDHHSREQQPQQQQQQQQCFAYGSVVVENVSIRENVKSADNYFPLPNTTYWNSNIRYGPREVDSSPLANGTHQERKTESLKRSETSETSSPETKSMPPPKKKWIKNYMEEEPPHISHVFPRNGVRIGGPPPPSAPIAVPTSATNHGGGHMSGGGLSSLSTIFTDSVSDTPRARSNSNGSSGPRAGTREVHNKLEKNRRAHLKECFEALRLQLPLATDDKKSSNLSILDSAIKCIQVLKRREKDLEHEMERLAREKIAHQQKLSALRRDIPTPTRIRHPTNHDRESAMEVDEPLPSRVSPIFLTTGSNAPISVSHGGIEILNTTQSSTLTRISPLTVQSGISATLDLTTKSTRQPQTAQQPTQIINLHSSNGSIIYSHLSQNASPPHPVSVSQRTQPAQIISSFSQSVPNGISNPKSLNLTVNPNVQTGLKVGSISSNLPTLTVTTVNPGSIMTVNQGQITKHGQIHGQTQPVEGKVISSVMTSTINGQTAIVHPAQFQLPISQVMNGSGLVVSPTIQLFSTTPQSLRVLQAPSTITSLDIPNTGANNSVQRIRDGSKSGETNIGVNLSAINGVVRTTGSAHHIAIKPQVPGNINSSIRPSSSQGNITHMVNGLTPLVVSQGGPHLMATSSNITGKMMANQVVKTGMPLAVNTQYLSAATIVKPVVVVSTSNGVPPTSSS